MHVLIGRMSRNAISLVAALTFQTQFLSAETIDQLQSRFPGYSWSEKGYSNEPSYISGEKWREVYRAFEGSWDGRSVKDHNHRMGYIYDPQQQNLKVLFFLYNAHETDGDTVCLFASWNDAERNSVIAQFMRLGINAQLTGHANRRVEYQDYLVPLELMESVETVSFAVKECDRVDDRKFFSVIVDAIKPAAIGACTAYTGQIQACTLGTEAIAREAQR